MKLDLASVTSQDLSSAWIDAIPKLVQRRGGIAVPMAGTLRKYSDSGESSFHPLNLENGKVYQLVVTC